MYNFDSDEYPRWANEDADWAFSKNTVTQLGCIGLQLTENGYSVESGIDLDNDVDDNIPLREYQESIKGLVISANNKSDSNDHYKRIIVRTDARNDSIVIQAGFDGNGLWNNGIIYDEMFSKDELGKFSKLWERVYNNFVNNQVIPIKDNRETIMDSALTKFIQDGVKQGYVKRVKN